MGGATSKSVLGSDVGSSATSEITTSGATGVMGGATSKSVLGSDVGSRMTSEITTSGTAVDMSPTIFSFFLFLAVGLAVGAAGSVPTSCWGSCFTLMLVDASDGVAAGTGEAGPATEGVGGTMGGGSKGRPGHWIQSLETIFSRGFFFFLGLDATTGVSFTGLGVEVANIIFPIFFGGIILIYYGYNLYSANSLLTRPRTSIFSKLYGLITSIASEKLFHSILLTSVL